MFPSCCRKKLCPLEQNLKQSIVMVTSSLVHICPWEENVIDTSGEMTLKPATKSSKSPLSVLTLCRGG